MNVTSGLKVLSLIGIGFVFGVCVEHKVHQIQIRKKFEDSLSRAELNYTLQNDIYTKENIEQLEGIDSGVNEYDKDMYRAIANQYWKVPDRKLDDGAVQCSVSKERCSDECQCQKSVLEKTGATQSLVILDDLGSNVSIDITPEVIDNDKIKEVNDIENQKEASDEHDEDEIVRITVREFVNAINKKAKIVTILFDSVTREFCPKDSDEKFTYDDAADLLGEQNCNEIIDESLRNPYGMIEHRFLYNKTKDIYLNVLQGVLIN